MMIQRDDYLNELKSFRDKDLIKVITGIKRCGKSTLFELFIDFLKGDGLEYYQVALTIRDEKVLARELRLLQKTGDHYPKYILTMDMDLESDYDGITKINVVDWLLSKSR